MTEQQELRINSLKLASNIHKNVVNDILDCYINNTITINLNNLNFYEITLLQLRNYIHNKIKDYDGELAFPIGLSGDCIVAHYTPLKLSENMCSSLPYYINPTSKISQFKILKIDFGVHINGFIIDKAFSLNISNTEKEAMLINASNAAVNTIINNIKIDSRLNELADYAREIVESYEYKGEKLKIVENVYSHNINRWHVHGDKFIKPDYKSYDNIMDEIALEGEQYAIEIYASDGIGTAELLNQPNLNSHFRISKQFESSTLPLLKNEEHNKLLQKIKENETLPFCPHMISLKLNKKVISDYKKVNYLNELHGFGILESYPPIIEKDSKCSVSQIEENIIVSNYDAIKL